MSKPTVKEIILKVYEAVTTQECPWSDCTDLTAKNITNAASQLKLVENHFLAQRRLTNRLSAFMRKSEYLKQKRGKHYGAWTAPLIRWKRAAEGAEPDPPIVLWRHRPEDDEPVKVESLDHCSADGRDIRDGFHFHSLEDIIISRLLAYQNHLQSLQKERDRAERELAICRGSLHQYRDWIKENHGPVPAIDKTVQAPKPFGGDG